MLLTLARFFILIGLFGLYGWFCYTEKKFVDIPLDVWVVGLLCAGPAAVDLFSKIRGILGESK